MELRLIEIYLPEDKSTLLEEILKQHKNLDFKSQNLPDKWLWVSVLLPEEETEKFIDELNLKFEGIQGFRVIILNVAATLPRPEPPEKEPGETQVSKTEEPATKPPLRISREELYTSISDAAEISRNFIVLLVLSSIVAAIGLEQNNLVVIIGAMVIAPLLGPNIALALATTLGDGVLVRRALKAGGLALLIVLVLSVILGLALNANPNIPEIASRTKVNIDSIIVALASGSAGALAFTTSLSAALVGVMVAVALLPPLVTFGMLLGQAYWLPASRALLLVLINIVSINLAAVATFVFQGIRPARWWEAERAKKTTRIAVASWLVLLAVLTVLIVLSQR